MPDEPEEDLTAIPKGTVLRISALMVVALVLGLWLAWLLSGGGAEFFRTKFTLRSYLGDASGLKVDAFVMLNGVTVGRVDGVSLTSTLDPNRIVEVRMSIQKRYMGNIPIDSIAAVTATDLLGGDEYINIVLGTATEHIADGAEVASLIQSGSFNPSDLVASLRDTMSRIDFLLTDIQQGRSPLSKLVHGDALYVSIGNQLTVLEKSIASFADRKSPNGQLIYSDADYRNVSKMVADLDHSLGQIQSGQGAIGKLFNDPSQYNSALTQIRKVHRTLADDNAGKGAAGQWLVADDKYQQLRSRVQSIDKSVDRLTDPNSGFGKLMQSRALYDSLNQQGAKARDFEREFRENPRKFERIQVRGGKKKKATPHP